MTRIYTEIGIGNPNFVSTEIETNDTEMRQKGFVPMRLRGVYLRLWVGERVYILSSLGGFVRQRKSRKAFKLLLGFEGVST